MAILTIKSRDFGAYTNGIRVSLVADATADATLPLAAGNFIPWTFNVSLLSDKKSYSYRVRGGLLVTPPVGGTLTFASATQLITLEDDNGVSEATWTQAPTLRHVADWINSHSLWTAKVIGSGFWPTNVMNDQVVSGAGTAIFCPAESGLLAYLVNSSDPLVSITLDEAPTALVAIPETSLSGGLGRSTDELTADDLAPALALASTIHAHGVFVQSASESLQQLVVAHCAEMSDVVNRKYRIAFLGINFTGTSNVDGADATAIDGPAAMASAIGRAAALDGPAILAFNGTSTPNPLTGVTEQLGGLGLAAQALGAWCGGRIKEPLTNKPMISKGLEFPSLLRGTTEDGLMGGVFFPFYDSSDGRTKIVQAITTLQSLNPSERNLQGLAIQHEISRLWILVLSNYVGTSLDLETGERIKTDCAKALDSKIVSGHNPDGYLTPGRRADGTSLPAWEGLSVVGDSTTNTWTIDVNAHPVGEADFIHVRTKLTPQTLEL